MDAHIEARCGCGAGWWVLAVIAHISADDEDPLPRSVAADDRPRRMVCGACGDDHSTCRGTAEPSAAPISAGARSEAGAKWAALAASATALTAIIVLS
jgi:hypothetical protein